MHTSNCLSHSLGAMLVAASLAALPALADTSAEPNKLGTAAYTPQPSGPSAFKLLRTQCEKDVPIGKASGDICAQAAAILVGNDLPDEFRETREDQRIRVRCGCSSAGSTAATSPAGVPTTITTGSAFSA